MKGSVVPAALSSYCVLRGLSHADALAELDRLAEILGPRRPILFEEGDAAPTGPPVVEQRRIA